jgi:hypothetical protein
MTRTATDAAPKKIALTRIDGERRAKVEYSVDAFARAYALNDEPETLNAARALAERLAVVWWPAAIPRPAFGICRRTFAGNSRGDHRAGVQPNGVAKCRKQKNHERKNVHCLRTTVTAII